MKKVIFGALFVGVFSVASAGVYVGSFEEWKYDNKIIKYVGATYEWTKNVKSGKIEYEGPTIKWTKNADGSSEYETPTDLLIRDGDYIKYENSTMVYEKNGGEIVYETPTTTLTISKDKIKYVTPTETREIDGGDWKYTTSTDSFGN